MSDVKKSDIHKEAAMILHPIVKESEKRKKAILKNAAIIISVSVVILTIVLYAFNRGFCQVYNLPVEVMPLDLSKFIPLVIQLAGIIVYILFYASSIKADAIFNKNKFDLLRILWGIFIAYYILSNNNIDKLIGRWWSLGVAVALPIAVELFNYFRKKPRKDKKVSKEEHDAVLEDVVKDSLFSIYYIKHGLFFVVIPIVLASWVGIINANAEREYQTFIFEDTQYAVVVNYTDQVLAQRALIDDSNLSIDIDNYYFFSKDNLVFSFDEFDNVEIGKSILDSEMVATEDELPIE